jgi:PUA domain protein
LNKNDVREFYLSKKDTKNVLEDVKKQLKADIPDVNEKGNRIVEVEKDVQVLLFDKVVLIKEKDKIFPSLFCAELFLEKFPSVKVDKGAIPYICKGAKVMRPGIVAFEKEFYEGDVVCVKDEAHSKYIAIGRALLEKGEAEKTAKGAVLDNLHYVGDKYWDTMKNMKLS